MRASDGHLYAVKFRNNPISPCVLFNELFGTRLAQAIGLPVPEPAIIYVGPFLIANTSELTLESGGKSVPCDSGLHFGSRYIFEEAYGATLDYLPRHVRVEAVNINVFAGALAFDLWTGNLDSRQAVFWRRPHKRGYSVTLIDNSHCFNTCGDDFSLRARPLLAWWAHLYENVFGCEDFEPWLSRIETLSESAIADCASGIPSDWYTRPGRPGHVIQTLLRHRHEVRTAILELGDSGVFKNWNAKFEEGSALQVV